jgi:hypothetical protein
VDRDLKRVSCPCRRLLAPERVDQRLPPDELVRMQEQEGEERALARAADRQHGPVALHLERAEQAELEHSPGDP